jgi:hypothetical protein
MILDYLSYFLKESTFYIQRNLTGENVGAEPVESWRLYA